MKYCLLIFCFISLSANVYSQETLIILNAVDLDTTRYDDYKGSPYFFEDWVDVTIKSVGGVAIQNVKGNYNGLEGEWEIAYKNQYTNLPLALYTEIEVKFDESLKISEEYPTELVFSSIAHPDLKNKYVIVLIDKPELKLFEDFYTVDRENKTETPGQTLTIKTLNRRSVYKIEYKGELIDLKPSKKGMVNVFGNKKLIEKQLSKTKNKLKTSKDVVNFINELIELDLID